jgi:hypothetical protein
LLGTKLRETRTVSHLSDTFEYLAQGSTDFTLQKSSQRSHLRTNARANIAMANLDVHSSFLLNDGPILEPVHGSRGKRGAYAPDKSSTFGSCDSGSDSRSIRQQRILRFCQKVHELTISDGSHSGRELKSIGSPND